MNHEDAYVADVLVVLDVSEEKEIPPITELLKAAGLSIDEIDAANAVVQGSIDASKVKALENVGRVHYCRVLETYIADYPQGDPRDLDGPDVDDASRAE